MEKIKWWHWLLGLLFMVQPIFLPSQMGGPMGWGPDLWRDVAANALMIVFFMVNYRFMVPRWFLAGRYFLYSFSLLVWLAGLLIVSGLVGMAGLMPMAPPSGMPMMQGPPMASQETVFEVVRHYFAFNDHIVFLYLAMVLFTLVLKIRERLAAVEAARYEAEIAYLSAQINPHFLFNALNSVYALAVRERAARSSEALLKLAGIMRYVVTEAGREMVPLRKEIEYISDFIALQRLRLDASVGFSFEVRGVAESQQIAPLLLIPFVENAFKHGVNPDEDCDIHIFIAVEAQTLRFFCRNNKVATSMPKTGVGLANARSRLALQYPNRHELSIEEDAKIFQITLKIDL